MKRSGAPKVYRYPADNRGCPASSFCVDERTAGTRYLTRESSLDARGRATKVVERSSELSSPQGTPQAVPSQGTTTTELTWNDDENKVATLTEAAGTPEARVMSHSYSALGSGALTRRLVTSGSQTDETFYDYYTDREAGFIADLQQIRMPGGRTWRYEVAANTGNVGATITPNGVRMISTYGTGGVLASSQDEMLRTTRYSLHDPTGQPQQVNLPDADGTQRTWRYRYDARGDVTKVIDPRGGTDESETGPYVTSLAYDGFGRMVRERVPRDSGPEAPAGALRFVERTRRFDRDGNPVEMVDARSLRTTVDYDATGQPVLVKQPGSNAVESTVFAHDDAQRQIAQVRPKGVDSTITSAAAGTLANGIRDEQTAACEGSTPPPADRSHLTRKCLDHRGRTRAQVQYAPGQTPARRITSFAYDGRDNALGEVDPKRNLDATGQPLPVLDAIARADNPALRRFSRSYDELDRPLRQAERPTEAGQAERVRRLDYDDAGDLITDVLETAGQPDRKLQMDYDAMGRLLSRTDPLGRMTCWRRQADGLVASLTTPRGTKGKTAAQCADPDVAFAEHTTRYDYNVAGELTSRSVPYAASQYGPGRDDVKQWRVTYERDAVGNPKLITDARGNSTLCRQPGSSPPTQVPGCGAITNRFYDGGELRSTSRPSWWSVDWPEDASNPRGGERFSPDTEAADTDVSQDGPVLRERQGRSANSESPPEATDKPASLGKTDFGEVDPAELPGLLPPAGTTEFQYDADMRLNTVVAAGGRERRLSYDAAGRVDSKSWPLNGGERILHDFKYDANGNLTASLEDWMLGKRSETTFQYDGFDRRTTQATEGAGAAPDIDTVARATTSFAFDVNDNLTQITNAGGRTSRFGFDSLDQLATEANPAGETWKYTYDRFGDRIEEEAPHAAAAERDLYTTISTFDAGGQLQRQARKVDEPGQAATNLEWTFDYDEDGNTMRSVRPGTDNGPITTEVDHDGRGLPWRTTVSGGSGTAAKSESSIVEHDPNGNLRRSINPAGLNQDRLPVRVDNGTNDDATLATASEDATVRTYTEDDLVSRELMPWKGSGDTRYERRWEREASQGWVTGIKSPFRVGAETVFRTTYAHNDAGWVTSASDETRAERTDEEKLRSAFRYSYDQRGAQIRWRSEHAGQDDRGRDLRWTHWPNGLVRKRSATKTLDGGAEETSRSYGYGYNANRSLTRVTDSDAVREQAGSQKRTTNFGRDVTERETRIDETWRGGNDVQLEYATGATGWLTRRRTDGDFGTTTAYGGPNAKSTTFHRDSLGRELTATVDPAQGIDRITRTRWFGGGQMRERTKPNGTRDRWSWDGIGRKQRHDRMRSGEATDPESESYAYDANGNRTRDERGTHQFNARDQLTRWDRPTDRGRTDRRGWSTSYELDGSGATTKKTERNRVGNEQITSTFALDGERLNSSETLDRTQAVNVTTKQYFRYDDVGNVQRAYSRVRAAGDATIEAPPPPKTSLSPAECEGASDTVGSSRTTRYCYDEFNRQVFASGSGTDGFYASYDGLDRRDRRVKRPAGTSPETEGRNYTYLGSSELLASEDTSTVGLSTRRVSFDYDSAGDRLGQQRDEGTSSTYKSYAKDANGSVVGLEASDGSLADDERYDYDPYGATDRSGDQLDPDAGLSGDAKANPFRFEGFYFDSSVGSYDMHARQYQPDTGRFLSRDTYASAAGDQALSADPLTQNRYAFAGANPVNNIEFDGHIATTDGKPPNKNNTPKKDKGGGSTSGLGPAPPKSFGAPDATPEASGAAPLTDRASGNRRVAPRPAPRPTVTSAPLGKRFLGSLKASFDTAKTFVGNVNGAATCTTAPSSDSCRNNIDDFNQDRDSIAAFPAFPTRRLGPLGNTPARAAKGGDLTRTERRKIQKTVDAAGRPITAVGSAARGERRNRRKKWLPFGKGPGTRSDIDYAAPRSSLPYFDDQLGRLPGLDPSHGIIPGPHDSNIGPGIRFEPRR